MVILKSACWKHLSGSVDWPAEMLQRSLQLPDPTYSAFVPIGGAARFDMVSQAIYYALHFRWPLESLEAAFIRFIFVGNPQLCISIGRGIRGSRSWVERFTHYTCRIDSRQLIENVTTKTRKPQFAKCHKYRMSSLWILSMKHLWRWDLQSTQQNFSSRLSLSVLKIRILIHYGRRKWPSEWIPSEIAKQIQGWLRLRRTVSHVDGHFSIAISTNSLVHGWRSACARLRLLRLKS